MADIDTMTIMAGAVGILIGFVLGKLNGNRKMVGGAHLKGGVVLGDSLEGQARKIGGDSIADSGMKAGADAMSGSAIKAGGNANTGMTVGGNHVEGKGRQNN